VNANDTQSNPIELQSIGFIYARVLIAAFKEKVP
jgi:hypothetical protein